MPQGHVAVETIVFAHPLKGRDIIAAVKHVIGNECASSHHSPMFHQEFNDDASDRFIIASIIGQESETPYQNIRVTPSSGRWLDDRSGFVDGMTYKQVTVMDWTWPNADAYMVGFTDLQVIEAVSGFTQKLRDHLGTLDAPSDEPQTVPVEIFLVYENSIDWSDGRSYFKTAHGSLDEAKQAIPENTRSLEREPDREMFGPEYVLEYTYFTIRKQEINVPVGVLMQTT